MNLLFINYSISHALCVCESFYIKAAVQTHATTIFVTLCNAFYENVTPYFSHLQGMSEEAVRQTRSQKRALERDPAPQSMEPSNSDNESKKPKLDPSEQETQVQNSSAATEVVAEDGQNQTLDVLKQEEQSWSPLPSAFPLASQAAKNHRERQEGVEPGSESRTDSNDRVSRVKTEQADLKSRAQVTDPKIADGMLAAGEVKATIKVEVQTAEQPMDMSTSRG